MHRRLLLDGLPASHHFLIIDALVLQVDAGDEHLVGISVHTQHLALGVLIAASDHLHEVVLNDVPPAETHLLGSVPEEPLLEGREEAG